MHPTSKSLNCLAALNKLFGKNFSNSRNHARSLAPVFRRNYQHSTEKNVIASSYYDVPLPNTLLFEHVFQNMDRWADKTAVVCGLTGRGYTYDQAYKMTRAFAACLRTKLKLKDGDTLAIMMPNQPEFPLAVLGAMQAGCIVTSINPIYTSDEVANQIVDSEVKVIVLTTAVLETVRAAIKKIKRDIIIIACPEIGESTPSGTINFAEFAENFQIDTECLKEVRRKPEDIAFLPYSSGTTGLPKGVMLSHKNITANIEQLHGGNVRVFRDTTADFQDCIPSILPFFHIYGFTAVLMSKFSTGCKIVTLPKFTPETFLNAQEKYQGTVLHLVPPIVLFMAMHPSVGPKHLDCVRTVFSGAAPLAETDVARFLKRCKNKVSFLQGYGLTETSPVVLLQERGSPNYSSVGSPVSCTDCKIVSLDSNNTSLGPNKEGELWVRGPQVMMGYYKNEKANEEIFAPGGWLKTGDLGYYDDDHVFYITDRLKELIKVKGYQVAPAELEGILRDHPSLSDAAVIGIPDQRSGEVPKAFVVLKSDKTATEADIISFLVDKVAPYKNLGAVQFVTAIPKNASGKILRRELKKMYL